MQDLHKSEQSELHNVKSTSRSRFDVAGLKLQRTEKKIQIVT